MGRSRIRLPVIATGAILSLAGCAPTAFTGASAGFDGMSYATDGKSMTDLAISQARHENCSTWRIFTAKPICRPYTPEEEKKLQEQYAKIDPQDVRERRMGEPDIDAMNARTAEERQETMLASAQAAQSASSVSAANGGGAVAAPPAPPKAEASQIGAASPSRPGPNGQYLVLGSFASRANAERALAFYPDSRPAVAAMTSAGRPIYRIVSGPFSAEALADARKRLEQSRGVHDAWIIPSCGDARTGDACITPREPELAAR